MNYLEYKSASARHLHTCINIAKTLSSINNSTVEKALLLNLYYLSGYVIECIVNYAIYDYVKFGPAADVSTLTPKNNLYDVSFFAGPMLKRKFQINRNPKYVIQTHRFQYNCQFFAANGVADANKVPQFDGNIADKSIIKLFDLWKPEVRYTDYGFSKGEIIGFTNLAEEIHTKTRQFITKN
jgi:hypothetical protein